MNAPPAPRRSNALGVHSLDHFAFTVPDIADAERFYQAFGLDVRRDGNRLELRTAGNPHRWAVVVGNGAPKRLQYLSFSAYDDDVDALACGVARGSACEPHALSDGGGTWLRDPDGTPVQLIPGPKVSSSGKVAGAPAARPPHACGRHAGARCEP